MSHTVVQYTGVSDNGYSPNIWHDCPWFLGQFDNNVGYGWQDDFVNISKHDADADNQTYDVYIDTGVTMNARTGTATPGVGGVGGVLEVAGNDADNDEGNISGHSPAFVVSDTAANAKKLWFEARISKDSIANNGLSYFIGLAWDHGSNVSLAIADALTDNDGALGAFSYLGFHVDAADGDALDCVYRAEGQAATVNIAGVQTLVADTYYKVGFVYDPDGHSGRGGASTDRIAWYVDNTVQSTYVTATNIAAATFPDEEPMAMAMLTKVGTAAEVNVQLDWWRCFQVR